MVPIPVQHRSSDHGDTVHQEGIMESLSGNGIIYGSSSFSIHNDAYTPVSSPNMSSSSLQFGTETQGIETQVSIDIISLSQHIVPLLPNLDSSQFQVILLLSSQHAQTQSQSQSNIIQTRLKIGAIMRRDYIPFLAALPELSSLQLIDGDTEDTNSHIPCGFSFLDGIHEAEEPKNFKATSTITQW